MPLMVTMSEGFLREKAETIDREFELCRQLHNLLADIMQSHGSFGTSEPDATTPRTIDEIHLKDGWVVSLSDSAAETTIAEKNRHGRELVNPVNILLMQSADNPLEGDVAYEVDLGFQVGPNGVIDTTSYNNQVLDPDEVAGLLADVQEVIIPNVLAGKFKPSV